MDIVSAAASAVRSQGQRLDAIANNIANLNTVGYQSVGVSFADTLTQVYNQSPAVSGLPQRQTPGGSNWLGTGVYTLPWQRSFQAGAYKTTGNPLDMAVTGPGFFMVRLRNGQTGFTRAGNFALSRDPANGRFYLADAQGNFVLGANGRRLDLTNIAQSSIRTAQDGVLTGKTVQGATVRIGRLGLAFIANPASALHSLGGDVYGLNGGFAPVTNATPAGGVALTGTVQGGTLEQSNVNLTEQMAQLVQTQHDYNAAVEGVSIADKMAQSIASL